MDRRSWCIRALTAILLASSLAYSSLGWCPPPPGSPLLPNGLILDFWNGGSIPDGSPYDFLSGQSASLAVRLHQWAPGATSTPGQDRRMRVTERKRTAYWPTRAALIPP